MSFATSLTLTGAEVGLSLTGLALLLVTAWSSHKAARAISSGCLRLVGLFLFAASLLWGCWCVGSAWGVVLWWWRGAGEGIRPGGGIRHRAGIRGRRCALRNGDWR